LPKLTSIAGVSPKRILICDDDVTVRLLLRVVLDGDYEFDEASDGTEALEVARRENPDLVVLDIMLPQRNGFDVLEELRRDARLRDVPTVVVTASPEQEDAALAAGADRFFMKPFEPDELRTAVAELLAR
jgi:CheY-like chemotaxis protein